MYVYMLLLCVFPIQITIDMKTAEIDFIDINISGKVV